MPDWMGREGEPLSRVMSVAGSTARAHGYSAAFLPLVEDARLFSASLGGESDVVMKVRRVAVRRLSVRR